MDFLPYITGPVIGAVIGYITNDIAIRMLFRPHKAVTVLGHRLPFTPGIVPRRKDQLAKTLGDAIVAKFFNADDLEIIFTTGIAEPVAEAVSAMLRSELRPAELWDAVSPNTAGIAEKAERELCVRIQAALALSELPETFAQEGIRMASGLVPDSPAASLALSSGFTASLVKPLAHEIREFIIERGGEYIAPLLRSEAERLSGTPVRDLTALLYGEDNGLLRETVKSLYLRFMSRHVRPIVESIDVGGMITEKIILMTSEEVEDLVLTVVRKELRLVVLFGAFVGGIIGTVNIFL